ncbi:hypothetical protein BJ912DRAFT_485299 [Pholiota molesta]|nr:hypothetical protein BJ912DRAFT_485299 [Pholiota molesta]
MRTSRPYHRHPSSVRRHRVGLHFATAAKLALCHVHVAAGWEPEGDNAYLARGGRVAGKIHGGAASVCDGVHVCVCEMCVFVCGSYDRHDRPASVVFYIPYAEFGPLPLSIIPDKYRGHHHPLCIPLCLHQESRMRRGRPKIAMCSAHSPSHHPQEMEGEDGGRNALSVGGCLHDWDVMVLETSAVTFPPPASLSSCSPRGAASPELVAYTRPSCRHSDRGLLSVDLYCVFVHPLFPVRECIRIMEACTGACLRLDIHQSVLK